MNDLNRLLLLALLFAPAVWAESPANRPDDRVRIEYVNPGSFSDIGDAYGSEKLRDARLQALREHLQRRSQEVLAPGQTLLVSVTDIDMAGRVEPLSGASRDLRVVRDVYPPRIDLSFKLIGPGGETLKSGERSLRDINFAMNGMRYPNDALRFEKSLLDEWLEREWSARAL
jgi:hypothetical protein